MILNPLRTFLTNKDMWRHDPECSEKKMLHKRHPTLEGRLTYCQMCKAFFFIPDISVKMKASNKRISNICKAIAK